MINTEFVVITWCTTAFPTARVAAETPANLVGALPVIKVAGLGGGRGRVLGAGVVDLECYGATRQAAYDLAGQVEDSVLYQMRGVIAGATVSGVDVVAMPSWRPYDNNNVRRVGMTIQVFHRDAAPTVVLP